MRRLLAVGGIAVFLALLCQATQALFDLLHVPLDLKAEKGPGQILFYLLMLAGLLLFVRFVWHPEGMASFLREYFDPANRRRLMRGFFLGAGATLAAGALGYCITFRIGGTTFDAAALARIDFHKVGGALCAAAIALVLVTTEEVIFRAVLYNYLRGGGGRSSAGTILFAVLGSALVFALAHGFRDPAGWLKPANQQLFAGLFLLGILLALAYEASGSLLVGMGIHTALIWTEVLRVHYRIILLDQEHCWWMGVGGDPRTGPFVWLVFALLIVAAWFGRRRLFAVAAVETGKPGFPLSPAIATPVNSGLAAAWAVNSGPFLDGSSNLH